LYILHKTSLPSTKRTQSLLTAESNWLMLYREIIVVYSERQKHKNTLCGIIQRAFINHIVYLYLTWMVTCRTGTIFYYHGQV